MCGFIGCIHNEPKQYTNEQIEQFKKANDIITHRGPDSDGYYFDPYVQFGFRRLSILDVEGASQPLRYEDDRYTIIFNGEIYNYVEIREMLIEKGYEFKTHGDTEAIIALYADRKEKCVEELRGMFAFLIWDKQEEVLFGARDHFGIKPLYYYESDETTYFCSEKKSLLELVKNETINPFGLQHYFTYQYVPEPETLHINILKVEPGHCFTKKPGQALEIKKYWAPKFQPLVQKKDRVLEEIRDVLRDSVKVHMRSDVPVGSFLSGGIDSSIIASLAKEQNPNILTFSVGFEHQGFSEVDVAKETADKLGVKNIDVKVTPEEYVKALPKIIWHMDDPLADPACVPLYFVAKEAAKHVTVVLSGEGADELFGGYNIYGEPNSLRHFKYVPDPLKKALMSMSHMMKDGARGKSFIQRGCTPIEKRYYGNAKIFTEQEKAELVKLYNEEYDYSLVTKDLYKSIEHYDDINKMQYIDMFTWLRGDILLKADKMTLAHSLELRVPFLDKEVFDVASKLDPMLKVRDGKTKIILREAVRGIVPDHVLDRKKLGFPVPIRHWLKNELHEWAVNLIHSSQTDYLINKSYVIDLLEDHCAGKMDYSRKIWTVLIFMLWHQIFIEGVYDISEFEKETFNHPRYKEKFADKIKI